LYCCCSDFIHLLVQPRRTAGRKKRIIEPTAAC
jgi:hypothetical protein